MENQQELQQALDNIKKNYGEFAYDIPLPFDIWTRGNRQVPHTRLKRIVQIIGDLTNKPFSECRILDLGCLDGIFSIELAQQGAYTVGVEIREANIQKAKFCKEVLGLKNLEFRQDDVRNIEIESYGMFDVIVCSGILYHLPAMDAIKLINRMYEIVHRVVVIDTHISLNPEERIYFCGEEFWGKKYREHSDNALPEEKEMNLLASIENTTSFWFTRPSLANLLSQAGFSSVYECFNPPHLNFGKPGLEHIDRCTFVAIKDEICSLKTSPCANEINEKWPEGSLSYNIEVNMPEIPVSFFQRVKTRIKELLTKSHI